MENRNHPSHPGQAPSLPTIQYLTAEDVMACVGVGRTTAYRIIKALNAELERDGYLTFPGKIPERKFREKLYLSRSAQLTTSIPKGRTTKPKK